MRALTVVTGYRGKPTREEYIKPGFYRESEIKEFDNGMAFPTLFDFLVETKRAVLAPDVPDDWQPATTEQLKAGDTVELPPATEEEVIRRDAEYTPPPPAEGEYSLEDELNPPPAKSTKRK